MRNKYLIFIVAFLVVIFLAIPFGIKNPPEKLKATDISLIHSVTIYNGKTFQLTQTEIDYWRELEFNLANHNYPGETPDYHVKLSGVKSDFSAIYNQDSDVIFFSFIPEIEYGFLNSPPPGGWNRPLYTTHADEKLLKLLRIK